LRRVLFSLANVTAQLSRGEPLSPEILTGSVPTTFPFGLCNMTQDVQRLVALRFDSLPTDSEFVGMTNYVSEPFHDLLTGESKVISDSNSSGGCHHPSCECFMADPPKGHVNSTHDGNTPPDASNDEARERNQAPPCVRLEQLRERQKELKEARLQLE
jgi:hypothetical protein